MAITYYRILNDSNSYGAPIKGGLIYEDFNDACDALEEDVRKFDPHFVPFDRDALYKMEDKSKVYHTIGNLHRLSLEEVKVVPKKSIQEGIREIPNLNEIARLLQGPIYQFKNVSVVEEANNCSYNVKYYPQDDDTLAYFLSLILADHRNEHILLHLHKLEDTNRYMIYMAVRE